MSLKWNVYTSQGSQKITTYKHQVGAKAKKHWQSHKTDSVKLAGLKGSFQFPLGSNLYRDLCLLFIDFHCCLLIFILKYRNE